ncbi:bifunctional methylenetetrahydrofolate dehydrogenase/methenyltetrahydrofolate cyclohydrolase FolD [Peptococcus simiae]|uniref:Bifunctional protein FolD n=1 Tax=Peptococcus simiae TaxID=1643805 RepID=A0ABW9H0E8_9FIRM
MQEISGLDLADRLRGEMKAAVEERQAAGRRIGLAVVLVGEDPASEIYVRNKQKACKEVGIVSSKISLPADVAEADLLATIEDLNQDDGIHGILVQLPLPDHIDKDKVINAIAPEKDVDGFTPINMGRLLTGGQAYLPCTPQGCLALLEEAGIDLAGKKAVVIGRSNIVGKPVALLLLQENATVTICHSKTQDLDAELADADVLVVAMGKAKAIKPQQVKDGVVIIDVGINRDQEGRVCGDVDAEAFKAADKTCSLTPVPGGVGPMTITMLLKNTLAAEAAIFALKEGNQ